MTVTSTVGQTFPDFDQFWNFKQPGASEVLFRELLPTAREGAPQDYYLQLLTQIARAQGLQRRFDEASATLEAVASLLNESTRVAEIRYYLEKGRVLNSAGNPPAAKNFFMRAFELAGSLGQAALTVDAAHMVAIAEDHLDQQIAWNLKAIKLAEESSEPKARAWLGSLYNNMAWTFHDSGRFTEALDLFERAVKLRRENGGGETLRIARWCVARCLRSLGRHTEALAIQLELEKELKESGLSDGYVFEELGELFHFFANQEEAQKYFALAYKELSPDTWLVEKEPARIARLKQLGGF